MCVRGAAILAMTDNVKNRDSKIMRDKLEELIPKEWLGKNRKAELIEILLPLFSVIECDCKVKGAFDEETVHRCRKCDKIIE